VKAKLLLLAACVALAVPALASAQITPVTTLQLSRVPGLRCSVSANGPQFLGAEGQGMAYGGSISCLHGVGLKDLTVWIDVEGSGANAGQYYIKSATVGTTGVRRQNPTWIGLMPSSPVVAGHRYRIAAQATVTWPGQSTSGTILSATVTDPGVGV
jgi:hypothetical protein